MLPIAAAELHHIKKDYAVGCIEKEEYKRLVGFAVDGDTKAFQDTLMQDVLMGTAIMFENGQAVYLEDTSIWEGLVQLRPQGTSTSYWTAIEMVD